MTSVEITFEDDPYEITVRVEHPLAEHALDKAEDLLHALAGVDDNQVEERMRGIVREELTTRRAGPASEKLAGQIFDAVQQAHDAGEGSPADRFRCPSCLHTWHHHREQGGCTVIACDCQQTIEGTTP